MGDKQMDQVVNLDLLKLMYLSREGDRREGVLLRQSRGWFQVAGMGHETLAVIALGMQADDYLFPYYRDRAMALARGVTNQELALAYFAKRDSNSGGRQMPGHYSFHHRKIWSVPTPTGANLLPACGVAWGLQLEGKPGIVVATTGDAATRQGEFYEAIAFATERKLPIVFVVEDNRYGISTNTDKFNPFKLGIFNEDLGVVHIDARHPHRLLDPAMAAMERARQGEGPAVLICSLDRLCSHTSSDDHRVYRQPQEISEMLERDPIHMVAQELIEAGELTRDDWESIQHEIDAQVDRDYQWAEKLPDPVAGQVLEHMWGDLPVAEVPPIRGGQKMRMVDSINATFHRGLESSRKFIFFGEDIEDPKGGVFRLTSGLSTKFPDRVFNSPLAEATIAGVACGLASYGMRPVFEFQFVDFVGPGWNQISQNLATLRWRTCGQWKCPSVFYAPYGAYLPGGSLWHSQANEAAFAHVPGLRVVVPSTPEDAAGLTWTALHADDPVVILLPKHLMRQPMMLPDTLQPVPLGKARLRREGSDVTLVAWGNGIELALDAAEELRPEISVEVIDLRSIQPWDREAIGRSLAKTGRLVIVQEDNRSCSVGQMILAELSHDPPTWYHLLSPPKLVSRPDVHIGFNPLLEYAALPSRQDVVVAIRRTLEE